MYSYTLEEVQALTELPPAPPMDRDFLTFEEWNWSLEDIKALNLPLSVMATVCPMDGSTKAVLVISDARVATVPMYIRQVSGALSVDWGDGSEPTTFAAATNANRTLEHTYAAAGKYIVTISTDGSYTLGHGSATTTFLHGKNQLLAEVYLGKGANVGSYGLLKYPSLRVATFALGVTTINGSAFWQTTTLESVSLPNTVQTIKNQSFQNVDRMSVLSIPPSVESLAYGWSTYCRGLKSVTIPPKSKDTGAQYGMVSEIYLAEGVQEISSEFLYNGIARTIKIPSTVESISGQAFRGCGSMEKMVFKPLVPPTVANSNAFDIHTWCIVEVPAESLEAYQNATNYAGIAAQMVGV